MSLDHEVEVTFVIFLRCLFLFPPPGVFLMEGVRNRYTSMHMNWEFSIASRVPVGPLDFKQEFYLYLEFGISLAGCLVGKQPSYLWEMKVIILLRS